MKLCSRLACWNRFQRHNKRLQLKCRQKTCHWSHQLVCICKTKVPLKNWNNLIDPVDRSQMLVPMASVQSHLRIPIRAASSCWHTSCAPTKGSSCERVLVTSSSQRRRRCSENARFHALTLYTAHLFPTVSITPWPIAVLAQQFSKKKKAKKALFEEKKHTFWRKKSTFCGAFYHIFWFEIKSCFSDFSLIMAKM